MTKKSPDKNPDLGKSALEALADPQKLERMQRSVIQLAQDPTAEDAHYVAEVAQHVETVIDRMGVASGANVGAEAEALLMVGASGTILAANQVAQMNLGVGVADNIRSASLTIDSLNRLAIHLKSEDGEWTILKSDGTIQPARIYLAMRYHAGASPASLIVALGDEWSDRLAMQIAAIFGFSASEVEVAKMLAAGHSTKKIAELRHRSVETVRSQVKALVSKTETANQAEMLRLFSQVQRAADWMDIAPVSENQSVVVKSPSGRQIQVVEFGDPNGTPLVFVHGSIGGMEPSSALQPILLQHNIRWIAVARPGYGQTDLAPSVEQNLSYAQQDLTDALAHLGAKDVSILGYSVGAATALEWAGANPERVRQLIVCSGAVPNFNARTQAAMPLGQKAMALAARLSPGLVRVLVKLGIKGVDQGGPEAMGSAYFKGASADQKALQDPVTLHHMWRAHRFHAASHVDAFVQDVQVANGRFWKLPKSLNCPIAFIHGAEDKTVPAALAHEFAERLNSTVHMVEGAGHLLPVSHWNHVFGAVKQNPERVG